MSSGFHLNMSMMQNQRSLMNCNYISNDDHAFILSPMRNNGALTPAYVQANNEISRGRVIIENTFGRMMCHIRRVRELQNYNIFMIFIIILGACILDNNNFVHDREDGEEHPFGISIFLAGNESLAPMLHRHYAKELS